MMTHTRCSTLSVVNVMTLVCVNVMTGRVGGVVVRGVAGPQTYTIGQFSIPANFQKMHVYILTRSTVADIMPNHV